MFVFLIYVCETSVLQLNVYLYSLFMIYVLKIM
jgi:hypothetical protein